mmetsp:Transcript_8320/g.12277  ORF Transcript_8320/g.12277 Transcript_8320/m.12277 type:complete len:200 (+) Transcript_8320:53-652(+)
MDSPPNARPETQTDAEASNDDARTEVAAIAYLPMRIMPPAALRILEEYAEAPTDPTSDAASNALSAIETYAETIGDRVDAAEAWDDNSLSWNFAAPEVYWSHRGQPTSEDILILPECAIASLPSEAMVEIIKNYADTAIDPTSDTALNALIAIVDALGDDFFTYAETIDDRAHAAEASRYSFARSESNGVLVASSPVEE